MTESYLLWALMQCRDDAPALVPGRPPAVSEPEQGCRAAWLTEAQCDAMDDTLLLDPA